MTASDEGESWVTLGRDASSRVVCIHVWCSTRRAPGYAHNINSPFGHGVCVPHHLSRVTNVVAQHGVLTTSIQKPRFTPAVMSSGPLLSVVEVTDAAPVRGAHTFCRRRLRRFREELSWAEASGSLGAQLARPGTVSAECRVSVECRCTTHQHAWLLPHRLSREGAHTCVRVPFTCAFR